MILKILALCFSMLLVIWSPIESTAHDEIFRKTVRTKRPNKLKEEIAQLCIGCLEYTTELLDVQAQLQHENNENIYQDLYRLLAAIQRALYARVKELAESDKNAFLNQASGRELQTIVSQIDSFVLRSQQMLGKLKRHCSSFSSTIKNDKKPNVQLRLDLHELKDLLREEKSFFSSGCKPIVQKDPIVGVIKK